MSAELLREAAKVLRERAEAATPECGWKFYDGGKRDDGTEPADSGLIAWISLMHPGIGLALADWLVEAAAHAQSNDEYDGLDPYSVITGYGYALHIARLILGGAS